MQRERSGDLVRYLIGLLFISFLLTCTFCHAEYAGNEMIAKRFNEAFQDWSSFIDTAPSSRFSSTSSDYTDNDYFRSILNLGPPVLPYIVDKIEKDRGLVGACMVIAFIKITKLYGKEGQDPVSWWRGGYHQTEFEFADRYRRWTSKIVGEPTKWKNLADDKGNILAKDIKGNEELKAYRDFLSLGIAALPYAFERLRDGKTELLDAIDYWTDNRPKKAFSELKGEGISERDFYLSWWEKNKEFWLLPQFKRTVERRQ